MVPPPGPAGAGRPAAGVPAPSPSGGRGKKLRFWEGDHGAAVAAAVERLLDTPTVRVRRPLYRAMYARYLHPADGSAPEPLFYRGSLAGRRFTPRKGPAGLYLSYDPSTLPAELRLVVFEHGFPTATLEHDPIVTVTVRASVRRVVDLTDVAVRRRLGVTAADLRADWEAGQDAYLAGRAPMPVTQLLALAAHVSGVVGGIKYPSARTAFGRNLVVFPDRLDAGQGDGLEVIDSSDRYRQRLP